MAQATHARLVHPSCPTAAKWVRIDPCAWNKRLPHALSPSLSGLETVLPFAPAFRVPVLAPLSDARQEGVSCQNGVDTVKAAKLNVSQSIAGEMNAKKKQMVHSM